MMRHRLAIVGLAILPLSGCLAATAVSTAGSAVIGTAKLATKGVYQMGQMTVNVADDVLTGPDDQVRLIYVTERSNGKTRRESRVIDADKLDSELGKLEQRGDVIEVTVEPVD